MILLDTSAIYAAADDSDIHHTRVRELLAQASRFGEGLLVHNYILVEAAAVLQRRLSFDAARVFLQDAAVSFEIHWVTPQEHREAVEYWIQAGYRRLSLVDAASFIVMRKRGVDRVLGFDSDFEREGFRTY